MIRFLQWVVVICFVSIPCLFGEEQKLKFNRDIRPILSDAGQGLPADRCSWTCGQKHTFLKP
jgi:hypothetical protein